jgi:hypothetical protein
MSEPRKKITGPNFRLPGHYKCYFDNIIDPHRRGEIKRLIIGMAVAEQESKKKSIKIKDEEE